jgi:hypothetical protein
MRPVLVLSLLAALAVPAASTAASTKAIVTIDASPHTVVYGTSTALSGTVLPAKADVEVSILSQGCATGSLPALAPSQAIDGRDRCDRRLGHANHSKDDHGLRRARMARPARRFASACGRPFL